MGCRTGDLVLLSLYCKWLTKRGKERRLECRLCHPRRYASCLFERHGASRSVRPVIAPQRYGLKAALTNIAALPKIVQGPLVQLANSLRDNGACVTDNFSSSGTRPKVLRMHANTACRSTLRVPFLTIRSCLQSRIWSTARPKNAGSQLVVPLMAPSFPWRTRGRKLKRLQRFELSLPVKQHTRKSVNMKKAYERANA